MKHFIFYFFAMEKGNINMALMLSVFVLSRIARLLCPLQISWRGVPPPPTSGSQAEVTDCGRAARVVTDGGGPGGRGLEVV